jgi:CNH domain
MHAQSSTKTTAEMVPKIAKEAHKKSKLPGFLRKGKKDKPKIIELVAKASVLGMVTYERDRDFLLVYDSQALLHLLYVHRLTFFPDLGCFVDQAGNPARTDYYIEWERKATAFARRGPHLLLFSPGYIEVRNIDTGKLFRMVEVNELRLLRSGLTEGRLFVGVMTGGAEADGSRTEKLVELVYHGSD